MIEEQVDPAHKYIPERTLMQRQAALQSANLIRSQRSQLKRELKAGRQSIQDIFLNPPPWVENMKVVDALLALPKYGRTRVNKILRICRIAPTKTIGGMSPRQRTEISEMVK